MSQVYINRARLSDRLSNLLTIQTMNALKMEVHTLREVIDRHREDSLGILNITSDNEVVPMEKNLLLAEFDQIMQAQSVERTHYYIDRLVKGLSEVKTAGVNDINLRRWKEYDDIITDSLWILGKRDNSGAHEGWYWGNFVPQIPNQLLRRYTKSGEWVLDPFAGSGTTLIECRRLGRNCLGIELNAAVAQKTKPAIEMQSNPHSVKTELITGDARTIDIASHLKLQPQKSVQFVLMHPPYHDIIKFSDSQDDLSNAKDVALFVKMFGQTIDNCRQVLDRGRYLGLVIGDKYSQGEWIPLGFCCMQEVLKRGFTLKSIIVKNFEETRGKHNQQELWRYRALVGGFYVFKHEYIMLFKKGVK